MNEKNKIRERGTITEIKKADCFPFLHSTNAFAENIAEAPML